jgi:hypothetical protein
MLSAQAGRGGVMPNVCRVYADMSDRFGIVSYCAVAVINNVPKLTVGDITGEAHGVGAEFEALRRGLLLCPRDSDVTAYSDIYELPLIMAGKPVSWYGPIAKTVDDLRSVGGEFLSIKWQVVDRSNQHYRKCHRQSRAHAKNIADEAMARWRAARDGNITATHVEYVGCSVQKKWTEL